jgi:predicted nucleotidyltransferase
MTAQKLDLPFGEISSLCSRYHVHELAVFGSFQRGESRPESDIDFLVDFLPEAEIGFLALSRMQRELAELLHRAVDLVPKAGLKPAIRKEILAEAYVIYAE